MTRILLLLRIGRCILRHDWRGRQNSWRCHTCHPAGKRTKEDAALLSEIAAEVKAGGAELLEVAAQRTRGSQLPKDAERAKEDA